MDKPEALRLADWFEAGLGGCEMEAAAELRRLHSALSDSEKWRDRDEARAENAERERDIAEAQRNELLAALNNIEVSTHDAMTAALARAAIAKTEEKK